MIWYLVAAIVVGFMTLSALASDDTNPDWSNAIVCGLAGVVAGLVWPLTLFSFAVAAIYKFLQRT